MIMAEAFASDDIALILPARRLRSRNTPERLLSASERLPPAFPWIVMTIAKKLTSAVGIASYIFLRPCSSVMPTRMPSHSRVNSEPTGSGISLDTILRASLVGRPDLTLRTITSIALANSAVNAFSLRFLMNDRTQRGRPSDAPKLKSKVTISACPVRRQVRAMTRPTPPDAIQNVLGSMSRPAISRRRRSEILSFFCASRASMSFSTCCMFLRRCAAVSPDRIEVGRAPPAGLASAAIRFCCALLPPANAKAAPPRASTRNAAAIASNIQFASLLQEVERLGELAFQPVIHRAFPETRSNDAGADMFAAKPSGFVLAGYFVVEQVLRNHHVAFGAHHFSDLSDAARAVAQTLGLDDHVDRAHDHFANRADGKLEAAHRDHRFQT